MPDFLSVSEFRGYLQFDPLHTEDDATLTALLEAAEAYIGDPHNGILGRPVAVTEFTEKFDDFDAVSLAFPDDAAITAINYTDAAGSAQVLGNIYELDEGELSINDGEVFPTHTGKVSVTYNAGFATAPEPIKTACYFYAASIFEGRDAEKMNVETLRRVIALMVGGYRRVTL